MNKKNLICSLVLFLMCGSMVNAQESSSQKDVVLMDRFTMTESANEVYQAVVTGIRDKVIAAIQTTGRVDIIDVNTTAIIKKADASAASESALESALASDEMRQEAVKQLNAKYAIQGHISNLRGVKGKHDDGSTYFTGELSISLKAIDLRDGSLVATKNYTYAGITGAMADTDATAVSLTADYLIAAVPNFIDEHFKIEGAILDITKVKKNKAKELYINLGELRGIQKGQRFKVYVKRILLNRESKKEIGLITVEAVEGEDISLCKVKKGDAEIFEAFKKDKESILIVSEKQSIGSSIFENVKVIGGGLIK